MATRAPIVSLPAPVPGEGGYQPLTPSLAAITPWEGCGDLMREQIVRGGIYMGQMFDELILKYMLRGRYGMESFREMFARQPLANDWWNDKRPDMRQLQVPTYITGTWSNKMHGMGAIRGWLEEWYDLWGNVEPQKELLSFFDHYLKGAENGWEKTPGVRVPALKFGDEAPVENIIVEDFPIPHTEYRRMLLGTDGSLKTVQTSNTASSVSYDAEDTNDLAAFTHIFDRDARVLGNPKAVLFMSSDDHDDMDIFVILRKLSVDGDPMLAMNIPLQNLPISSIAKIPEDKRTEVLLDNGLSNMLRASQRAIDPAKSMHENWPFHPQDKKEKIPPAQVVRLELGLWATGIDFTAGEGIQLQVSEHFKGIANFGSSEHVRNRGRHKIHYGGEYDSHVLLPIV